MATSEQLSPRTGCPAGARRTLALLLLLTAPVAFAQYNYTNNNGAITITSYTGTNLVVTVPSTIDNLPVTSIAQGAFFYPGHGVTSVVIPEGVTNIGDPTAFDKGVFQQNSGLTNVTLPGTLIAIGSYAFASCAFTAITIPDAVTTIGERAFGQNVKLTAITLPDSVLSIGFEAFSDCIAVTNVAIGNHVQSIPTGAFLSCYNLITATMGNSVTNLGADCFAACPHLQAVYFTGNAPTYDSTAFSSDSNTLTMYYLPGTLGWNASFAGHPTAPWSLPNPLILTQGPLFGIGTNGFGFIISWATNVPVVVEASADLAVKLWFPVSTNTLTNGWCYFTDPGWTNYPARFYRARSR